MRKTILLFLLFLSVTAVRTLGQNITFSHLTTDDGLSQFSVNSLYIDERGIIWIGTREGLNRYNGNDIKSFKLKKNDPNSLFSNTVLRITGNKNGKVYPVSYTHLDVYKRQVLNYLRGASPRISLASSGVAISLPRSLASLTTFSTISPLDLASTPFSRYRLSSKPTLT